MPFLSKMKQQKLLSFLMLLLTLSIGIVIGTVINTGVKADKQTSAIAPDATPLAVPQAVPIVNDFTKLTKRVEPSVVYIESDYLAKTDKKTTARHNDDSEEEPKGGENPRGQDPSDLFKKFFGPNEQRSFRTEGTGTGFIV